MQAVVLRRVGFLVYSCPKQGQDFKTSAATLYPNIGQVPRSPGNSSCCLVYLYYFMDSWIDAIPVFSEKMMRTVKKVWTIANSDNGGLESQGNQNYDRKNDKKKVLESFNQRG